jgi:hypothetical protein
MESPPYPPLPHTFLSPLKSYFKFPFRSPIASMSLLPRLSPSHHSYLNQFTHISFTFPSISMLFLLHLSMGSTPYLLHTTGISPPFISQPPLISVWNPYHMPLRSCSFSYMLVQIPIHSSFISLYFFSFPFHFLFVSQRILDRIGAISCTCL